MTRCRMHNALDTANTASDVWADTAYRSQANLACHLTRLVWIEGRTVSA